VNKIPITAVPKKVVSLVPSMTESLFDLGFGDSVVGITDYCIHPSHMTINLPRVGGVLDPRIEDILALSPDLVIANQEENSLGSVKALQSAGLAVWVTFPRTIRQALDDLWLLTELFRRQTAIDRLQQLDTALEYACAAWEDMESRRYFCPIWQGKTAADETWFMTFNENTFSNDILRLFGGVNSFAGRERRYPLEADLGHVQPEDAGSKDVRYPCVSIAEIKSYLPELIILPDEPYQFSPGDYSEIYRLLGDTPAVKANKVTLVEGSLITWPGTRIARALQELPAIFA
jgi:iron complex transport system substrate-binding protein